MDRFVDTGTGDGSIHNTPGIAFQEETSDTVRQKDLSINRSKRTSLIDEEALPLKRLKIDPKRNPANFDVEYDRVLESEDISKSTSSDRLLCLWKLLRKLNEKYQIYSKFSGFVIDLEVEQKKTVMTYLPPIETPITEYGTLFELFHRSEKMAKQSNMKYTHIT